MQRGRERWGERGIAGWNMLATYSMLSHSILFYVISITACPSPHSVPPCLIPFCRFSQCRLSFKQTTRANKVKYFYYLQEVFFGSSRCFCVSCCCCSSSATSLSYILWQRANKLQRLNCLCLLLPSLSLPLPLLLSVLFLCLRVDFILNKILYASCVWYMLYIRLMYVHGCLCSSFWEDLPWMSGKKPANCRPILRSALFREIGGVSHRKSEIMRRSWDLRHEARVREEKRGREWGITQSEIRLGNTLRINLKYIKYVRHI